MIKLIRSALEGVCYAMADAYRERRGEQLAGALVATLRHRYDDAEQLERDAQHSSAEVERWESLAAWVAP